VLPPSADSAHRRAVGLNSLAHNYLMNKEKRVTSNGKCKAVNEQPSQPTLYHGPRAGCHRRTDVGV